MKFAGKVVFLREFHEPTGEKYLGHLSVNYYKKKKMPGHFDIEAHPHPYARNLDLWKEKSKQRNKSGSFNHFVPKPIHDVFAYD